MEILQQNITRRLVKLTSLSSLRNIKVRSRLISKIAIHHEQPNFHCHRTGLNVQYWMEDEVVLMIAVALTKPSLSGLHAVDFINRSSSKLLGQKGGIPCIAFAPGYEIMAQQPHLGGWAIAEINFKKWED